MADYKEYNDAKMAINNLIDNKLDEIKDLQHEIYNLKQTRRMIDTEFNENMNAKENYLG